MVKLRYDTLYFYNDVDKFKEELDFVYNTYINNVDKIFGDFEIEAKKYEEHLYNNLNEVNVNDECNIPSEIYYLVGKRYSLIKNMKYRNLVTYISMICEMFEQFLFSIAKHQQIFISTDDEINKLSLITYNDVLKLYKKYNLNIDELEGYNRIDELRTLNNVIKHGDGPSMDNLKKSRPDYFENNNIDFYRNTIINNSLNLTSGDLLFYVNCIKNLINQFPDKIIHEYSI